MALSKNDVFKTNDPELVNAIRNIDLEKEFIEGHRLFNLFGEKIRRYAEYLSNYYYNISNNTITDNRQMELERNTGDKPAITHDLAFTFDTDINKKEHEYYQVSVN
jgi:hypothetical protein